MLRVPPDAAHLPERFGLFTLILLGEFVASVMRGIESLEYWTPGAASTAFASMAFAFSLRWWYFDGAEGATERQMKTSKQALLFHLWEYTHLPLLIAIGMAGVGFERVISLQAGEHLAMAEGWILCGAAAVLSLAITTIGATSGSAQKRRLLANMLWPQYILRGGTAIVGMYANGMHPVLLVELLLAAVAGQVAISHGQASCGTLHSFFSQNTCSSFSPMIFH